MLSREFPWNIYEQSESFSLGKIDKHRYEVVEGSEKALHGCEKVRIDVKLQKLFVLHHPTWFNFLGHVPFSSSNYIWRCSFAPLMMPRHVKQSFFLRISARRQLNHNFWFRLSSQWWRLNRWSFSERQSIRAETFRFANNKPKAFFSHPRFICFD